MKKIILSATVAAMALTTTASALEDIKVSGQAKVWYETNNMGDNSLFNRDLGNQNVIDNAAATTNAANDLTDDGINNGSAGDERTRFGTSGEVVFKLGVTGKQGNVGFGATVYQTSTMGLEGNLVGGARSNTTHLTAGEGEMYTGEMYVTVPVGAKTLLKFGKQELDTPLAFTERWNSVPNTFNAAVAINNSIDNLTLIAAYVGQGSNNGSFKSNGEVDTLYMGTATYAAGALYKNDAMAVNVWGYEMASLANALWADASMKVGPATVKAYAAQMMPKASGAEDTTAFALSAGIKVASIDLFAAVSDVSDEKGKGLPVANTATGWKKTKLPTMGVYTDGLFVGQEDSTAFKLKASTKLGGTGIALQYIDNSNDLTKSLEAQEIDLILSQKLGDFNLKAILMDRSFDDAATDKLYGAQHVRVIASVNF